MLKIYDSQKNQNTKIIIQKVTKSINFTNISKQNQLKRTRIVKKFQIYNFLIVMESRVTILPSFGFVTPSYKILNYINSLTFFMKFYDLGNRMTKPHWIGKEEFHSSHRANLLRKDYEYYSKFGWKEDLGNPYVWHDKEGLWYEQIVGTKERIYL